MERQAKSDKESHFGHLILILSVFVILAVTTVFIVTGQRHWKQQTALTQTFERCMQDAPFKTSLTATNPEAKLQPEELQKHFDQFNQIFKETGLPPIWNGQELVPWKAYHQESILVAKQCHEKIGITDPQKQLRGTYSKPVWDPNSKIWQAEPM